MAWEARWGLKLGTGSDGQAWSILGLNGLGSPLGIETRLLQQSTCLSYRLNGLGSPLGIETSPQSTCPMTYSIG